MEQDNNLARQETDAWQEYEHRRAKRRAERRKRKHRELIWRTLLILFAMTAVVLAGIWQKYRWDARKTIQAFNETKIMVDKPELNVQLLDVNEYSRPGQSLDKIKGIVIHYTANPGTTSQQNRDYFQGLKDSRETHASSHFIIGMDGEIIQCIPCNEISYASNDRNADTVAIECCIPDETGKFTSATYQSLVHLTAWLMGTYDVDIGDVIRHYDITEKMCPKYYVEHEDAWKQLKKDVNAYIKANGTKQKKVVEASE